MLIGATADRFLGANEPDTKEADVLDEIRALNDRLARIEAGLQGRER